MGTAAGIQVEVLDINEPQLGALRRRNLAHAHGPRFIGGGKANSHRPVVEDNFVGQLLGRRDLRGRERVGREIDGATLIAHVKRHSCKTVELFKCGRQHVLARVLLHVIAPPLDVDGAFDRVARLNR